jgi:peptidoglycan/LPS O-acetylase OafA/YrhL
MIVSRIPTLDGWRAVAILAVIVHHAGMCFYATEAQWELSATQFGAFGVDIFFGLSGLLITKLLLEERREKGSIDLRAFYIRRGFRILPPYLLFLAGVTIAGLWRSGPEIAGCLLFFRNYVPAQLVGRATQHLWSLAVEEHFYLLWPGLLFVLGLSRGKTAAGWLALVVALWRMVDYQLNLPLFANLPAHFRTDVRLDALLWGCVLAFLLDDPRVRATLVRQLRFRPWLVAVLVCLLCIRYYSMMLSVLLALFIPVVLTGTAIHPAWMISRVLDCKPLAWIGRISYSIYLWQQIFIWPAWEHSPHFWQLWPYNVIASFLFAAASYYFLERPLIHFGRRWAARSHDVRLRPAA